MKLLVAIQILLPLGLLLWLMLRPPRSWTVFAVHVAALLSILAALHLAGVWTVAPWWTPSAFLVGLAAVAGWQTMRRPPRRGGPAGWEWLRLAALLMPLALGAWFTASAIEGRREPRGAAVKLAWPLPPGRYLVINGGTNETVSSHAETLDLSVPRHRLFRGQSLGVDLVALTPAGRTTEGWWPPDPRRYAVYGRIVRAPCTGIIVQAVDGVPDQLVPELGADARTGNGVLMRCGEADIQLAHFAPGSLRVATGDVVRTGEPLGRAGNSGASNEPHLHIHAQRRGSAEHPLSGEPLPMRLGGRWLVRGDRVTIHPTTR